MRTRAGGETRRALPPLFGFTRARTRLARVFSAALIVNAPSRESSGSRRDFPAQEGKSARFSAFRASRLSCSILTFGALECGRKSERISGFCISRPRECLSEPRVTSRESSDIARLFVIEIRQGTSRACVARRNVVAARIDSCHSIKIAQMSRYMAQRHNNARENPVIDSGIVLVSAFAPCILALRFRHEGRGRARS